MPANPAISYLTNRSIDREKWDRCIDTANNGRIYAYSFYLDHMARQWDALVYKDYEAVMPLPWNSKFGIRYIYQPFLSAQLGVFGSSISSQLFNEFVDAIPNSFRLVEISLNSGNQPEHYNKILHRRINYTLTLDRDYQSLEKKYNENLRRNLKKAASSECRFRELTSAEDVIEMAINQMQKNDQQVADNIDRFRKLYQHLSGKQMASTFGIDSGNHIQSGAVFFYSHNRAYYILVGNHPSGRNTGASHALIDGFIRQHAGTQLTLDFEGSDITSLAQFYSSFGAEKEFYPFLKINRLPALLRWMKR